jgi:CRP-like cAMP-binding protein
VNDAEREAFVAFLRRVAPLPDAAAVAFSALLTPRRFAAHQLLLRAGDPAKWCFFLVSGLVREYYVAADGAEHTRSFITQGQMTGSLLDLLSRSPAVTFIEALEPVVALGFAYQDFDVLSGRYPALQLLARRNAEALYVRKASREYEMLARSAAERYRRWLQEHAGIDARISRRHLASYLGITPEHLSRLRRPSREPSAERAASRRRSSGSGPARRGSK